ncbi:MAG: WD40 repeat domain-containing protein, partial [Treponema sp.]|nr:WD40 repeat domain-containing protein [Treponema sp.]
MTKKKRFFWILSVFLFLAYVFLAARPVLNEITIETRWIGSLETGISGPGAGGGELRPSGPARYLLPFRLGRRFGYMDNEGRFPVNR